MDESAAFEGRVAWVCGATGAIGRAVCSALRARGAHVVATSRDRDALERLAAQIEPAQRAAVTVLPADLGERAHVDAAARTILQSHGRIDFLVNSTAVSLFAPFPDLDDEAWERVYRSKLFAYVRTIRAVLPSMLAEGFGRIVNVSGRGGHQPSNPMHLPGMSANAAVNLLTKGLANAYGDRGIRLNAIAPGPVASRRYDEMVAAGYAAAIASAAWVAGTNDRSDPDDIAALVLFLLSERSALLNGTVLQADRGSTSSL